MIFLACAIWLFVGFLSGSAFGPWWLVAVARQWRKRRQREEYRARHSAGTDGADESEPATLQLTVSEEGKLAALVAQFGGIDDEIAPEIGALVADHLRLSEMGPDIELTKLQLAVVDGLHAAAKLNSDLLNDPGFIGAMAISVNAVFELSALYRATV